MSTLASVKISNCVFRRVVLFWTVIMDSPLFRGYCLFLETFLILIGSLKISLRTGELLAGCNEVSTSELSNNST